MLVMKKIVIDARESGTSTGRYIDKLVEHMHRLQPPYDITVVTKPGRVQYIGQLAPGFNVVESDYKEFTFAEQLAFKKQLDGLGADLVHFNAPQQPVLYRGKTVTTIHDLTTARFYNPDKKRTVFWAKQQVYKWAIRRVARKSAAIIAISEFTKQDVLAFTRIAPEKVTVTYEAAEPIADSPAPLPYLQNKQFIMYIGRPTPHKNLPRLIEVFRRLQAQHPSLQLVLAGKMDNNYRRIEAAALQKGIKNVLFTDFITDAQLRWLYENCSAYVFPSLSEGFGLPGLEAMVHGAPVVSSNATCLPEIYGDAAHYFDPTDVTAMADAINEVLTDKNLRKKLTVNGKRRAAQYSWQRMAEQTLGVYARVLEARK